MLQRASHRTDMRLGALLSLKQSSALYFSLSSSGNSDRAFSVNGNVEMLRLIAVVIRDFNARNRPIFVAVLAALS